MSKPQGRCIYCGGTGLSKEHIFADWLREYIPRELTEHKMALTVQWPHKAERRIETKTGDTHARRLRKVCINCNGGWMSDLQQAAKPLLIPILQGQSARLNRQAQKIVAAWATMSAMTAEFLSPDMVATPQCERDQLRETRKPPRTWRIWLARYDGKNIGGRFWHRAMALAHEEVEGIDPYASAPSNTQATTIGFGDHLLIHMLSSEIAWSYVQRFRFPAPIKPNAQQIWPAAAASVDWPPGRPLSSAGVELLAEEFYRRVMKVSRKQAGL